MQNSWTNIYNERPSYTNLSIHQTLLSKALYEHCTDPQHVAAVAASSSTIRNSSLGANLLSLIPLDDESVVNLFTTVFHPSESGPVQFVSKVSCLLDRVDFEPDDFVEYVEEDEEWYEDDEEEYYEEGEEYYEEDEDEENYDEKEQQEQESPIATNSCCAVISPENHERKHTNIRVVEYLSTLKISTTYFCRSLRILELWYPCPSCIQALDGLVALHHLKLARYIPSKNDVKIFHSSSLPSLRTIECRFHYSVTDADIAHLGAIERPSLFTSLDLSGTKITDISLQNTIAKYFTNIHTLNLCKTTKVTDAGLESICSSPHFARKLKYLDLHFNLITNETVANHLSKLTGLLYLDLRSTKLLDGGLTPICDNLKNLTSLNVSGTRITDESLEHLYKLENLVSLDLSAADFITDLGCRHLLKTDEEDQDSSSSLFEKLTTLDLCETGISDEGLLHVSKLPNLTQVNLFETEVSDAGLEHIKKMKKLNLLGLSGCSNVTSTAQQVEDEMKKILPNLHVE